MPLFKNNFVTEKHWPVLILLVCNIVIKPNLNYYNFAHLTFILLLHYLVKCRSRSLAVYNNEFIMG